jgi:hypothetical protein
VSDPGKAFAVIIHSDILHRGLPREVDVSEQAPWRPMLKLQFVRTMEPQSCAVLPRVDWGAAAGGLGLAGVGMSEIWQEMWEWLHGGVASDLQAESPISDVEVAQSIVQLRDAPRLGGEAERLGAAFRLGRAARDANAAAGVALAEAL